MMILTEEPQQFPREEGDPQKSLQAGLCSCVILWGRVFTRLGKAECVERWEASSLQAAGNRWDFFF